MKNLRLIALLAFISIFASCSSNDDGDNTPAGPIEGNYFPLTVDDYWNYDVQSANNDTNESETSSDFLFVETSTGTTYSLDVNTNSVANGSMNAILVNGLLSRTVSTLEIDGTLMLPLEGFEDFTIDFTDVVLYDLNASVNSILSTVTGNFTQDFNGIPITVSYTLTNKHLGNINSAAVNGTTYTGITNSQLNVNMSIVTTIDILGNPTNFTILGAQDVLTITNQFAENVGLIKSEADIQYQLDATTISLLETAGITVDVPTSLSLLNVQELSSYSVQ